MPPLIRQCTTFFVTFKTIGKTTIDAIQENYMLKKSKKKLLTLLNNLYHILMKENLF